MSTELLISNIGYAFTTVVVFSFGLFVLFRGMRSRVNRVFFIFCFFIALFTTSHALGVNQTDPVIARAIFMWNACNIFIVVFGAHWVLALLGKERKRIAVLTLIYCLGGALYAFFMVFPDTFMGIPHPVLYFPNYYGEGPLYSVMVTYFIAVLIYFLFELALAYKQGDPIERNKLKYVIAGIVIGFAAGLVLELPLYGIYIDPIFSACIWVFTIPLTYAMVTKNLMDIEVVAKKATIYALGVVLLTIMIVIINAVSIAASRNFPQFPITVVPILSSIVVVLIGRFIWNKIKEAEVFKYEFMTIITHKFRTPLTSIRWAVENMRESGTLEEAKKQAEYIEKANAQLVQLSNILIESSTADSTDMTYSIKPMALDAVLKGVIAGAAGTAEEKGVSIDAHIAPSLPPIMADEERIRFVLQVFIDNAIAYTPSGKHISISLSGDEKWQTCEVRDEGIGIAKADIPRMFTKFYRSEQATTVDTEGVGVGLFMAKNIVERLGGKIWMTSEGIDKGTTVGFKLKVR